MTIYIAENHRKCDKVYNFSLLKAMERIAPFKDRIGQDFFFINSVFANVQCITGVNY